MLCRTGASRRASVVGGVRAGVRPLGGTGGPGREVLHAVRDAIDRFRDIDGMLATQASEEAMNSRGFLTYLRDRLIPEILKVKPDAVVVMDNLRSHRTKAVREEFLRAGLGLIYLPAYSPDLSPIEPAWSKFKAILRTLAARTKEALVAAVTPALQTITASDARGYFTHCGYDLALN